MASNSEAALNIFVGWDSREAVASDVLAHSIRTRTKSNINIKYLKHRELRDKGIFRRPWTIDADTGNFRDAIDARPFSTEFSHTRFLVPHLMNYQGWALFIDSDMIFQSDIKDLFAMADPKYAVMCVRHQHHPRQNTVKMDGRAQLQYHRKNWSSFVLWNCGHTANKRLTPEKVNFMLGGDLHAFSWLDDDMIGGLPFRYNYISGISPKIPDMRSEVQMIRDANRKTPPVETLPFVIHYTEGGPWFPECTDVPFADLWINEYEAWCRDADHGDAITHLPSTKHDRQDRR